MKFYRVFLCFVFLGLLAGAAYSQTTDPGVILRGDGASEGVGLTFSGSFQTTGSDAFQCATTGVDGSPTGDGSNTNCFYNNSGFTFTALHLFFAPTTAVLSCGSNSPDPFFQNCFVTDNVTVNGISTTEITFSGLGSNDGCGVEVPCAGIPDGQHFLLGLVDINGNPDTTDSASYSAVADTPTTVTPEPASALLFVIGIGAIALFLKRA
jgi:hypothetical protein